MFFHGSPTRFQVGDVLVPGANRGVSRCEHVYMTSDQGFSLTEAEEADYFGAKTTREFAIHDAHAWGTDPMTEEAGFLYVVEPMGRLEHDPHYDASPACRRAPAATVVAVFEGGCLPQQVQLWEESQQAAA